MSNLSRKYQQWRAMQTWERRLVVRLIFLLPVMWLVLRIFGFNRTRRMVELEQPPAPLKIEQNFLDCAQRYAQIMAIAARNGIFTANCLHQSLLLCWILARKGLSAQIRIGVRPDAQPFMAHAWVELNGVPLGQTVEEYRPFPDIGFKDVPPDFGMKS